MKQKGNYSACASVGPAEGQTFARSEKVGLTNRF